MIPIISDKKNLIQVQDDKFELKDEDFFDEDKNTSNNEQTKIIVTSFAPEPKSKSNILRPGSFQYPKNEDTNGKQQKTENYENNLQVFFEY